MMSASSRQIAWRKRTKRVFDVAFVPYRLKATRTERKTGITLFFHVRKWNQVMECWHTFSMKTLISELRSWNIRDVKNTNTSTSTDTVVKVEVNTPEERNLSCFVVVTLLFDNEGDVSEVWYFVHLLSGYYGILVRTTADTAPAM